MVYSFHWDCTIHLSFISQILLSTYNVPDTILGAGLQLQKIKTDMSLPSWEFAFQGILWQVVGK